MNTAKKTTDTSIGAGKEVGPEVNAEKRVYVIFRDQNAEHNTSAVL
jgi:hypothetical protein